MSAISAAGSSRFCSSSACNRSIRVRKLSEASRSSFSVSVRSVGAVAWRVGSMATRGRGMGGRSLGSPLASIEYRHRWLRRRRNGLPDVSRCATTRASRCSARSARAAVPRAAQGEVIGGDGGESNSPSRTLRRRPLRACPMVCRRPSGRASAPCRTVQSRAPRSGLTPDYATLIRIAASLHDASTTREAEAASTLTLLPKQRERESTGGCQVLLFAT